MLISMTTVTSAGQFAGIGIMMHPGQYFQMLISQITINIRYSFMSISVGQKADSRFSGISRWILGFMMTDEIFAVASQEDSVSRSFFAGRFYFVLTGGNPELAGQVHLLDPAFYLQNIPLSIPLGQLVIIGCGTLILSLLVSAIPAIKAGSEKPIETLRKI